jgi:group I intron endonuclease
MVVMLNMNAKQKYRLHTREYNECGIIYRAVLIEDGRIYIGQTIRSLKERISEHLHRGLFYFNKAVIKYGVDGFKWEIIDKAYSQKELDEKESYYINLYKSNIKEFGFNLTSGGEHVNYSDDVRKRISESMMGTKNHRYGKSPSLETRLKTSIALKGKTAGEKHYRYGKPSPNRKSIKCLETGEIFESITTAATLKNIGITSLSNCLNGRSRIAGKCHWEVV